MKRKRLWELVAFLLIFTIVFGGLLNVFTVKGSPGEPRLYSVYEGYAKNTEVLFAGSSHAGQLLGRNLWEDYGIAAYTIAGNSQPVDIMYYTIKEFLKCEKPKVIMVETAFIPDDSISEPDTEYAGSTVNDSLVRFSLNYMDLAISQIGNFGLPLGTEGVPLVLKWPLEHERYKDLNKDDFVISMPYVNTDLEPLYSTPEEEVSIVTTDRREKLSDVGEKYLNKIINLCEKEKIELVLFHTPYPAPEISMAQQNTISDIAKEKGVPFLDFDYLLDEIGFDPQTDQSRDLNHCNYYGAEKITNYIGEYLSESYDVGNHRGDPAYENWDKDLLAYNKHFLKQSFDLSNDISEWSNVVAANKDDFVLVFTLSGNYKLGDEEMIRGVLSKFGDYDEFYDKGGTLILDHGSVLFSSGDEAVYAFNHKFENASLSVIRRRDNAEYAADAPAENENDGIFLWSENYIKAVNGLNVMVYDDELDDVTDAVGIDVYLSSSELFRDKVNYNAIGE
jgi:hypothetical protein